MSNIWILPTEAGEVIIHWRNVVDVVSAECTEDNAEVLLDSAELVEGVDSHWFAIDMGSSEWKHL